jgi:hypothetical protein
MQAGSTNRDGLAICQQPMGGFMRTAAKFAAVSVLGLGGALVTPVAAQAAAPECTIVATNPDIYSCTQNQTVGGGTIFHEQIGVEGPPRSGLHEQYNEVSTGADVVTDNYHEPVNGCTVTYHLVTVNGVTHHESESLC